MGVGRSHQQQTVFEMMQEDAKVEQKDDVIGIWE
jgi:hypothetical protein